MAITLDREKIIDSARQQFAKLGLRKASLSDIARPLGVGKTAIYHHFPGGKRELMEEVTHREEQTILGKMRAAIAEQEDPLEKMRAMITAKLLQGQRLRKLLDVPQDVGEEIEAIYADRELSYNREEFSMIREIIESGLEQGIFSGKNPERLTSILQMIARRIEMTLVFEMNEETMQGIIDDVLDILFYGIVVTANPKGGKCQRGIRKKIAR